VKKPKTAGKVHLQPEKSNYNVKSSFTEKFCQIERRIFKIIKNFGKTSRNSIRIDFKLKTS